MAIYEIRYKGEEFGTIDCIEITKDQYDLVLKYIEGKTESRSTHYEVRYYPQKFGEPILVDYLSKELCEDVLEYLDVNKDATPMDKNSASMNKVKYSVVLKANIIKLVKKDYYKYLEKSILYGQCPLKFTKIKDIIFGNIEDGEVLINAEAYDALYPIFINVNSFASQYVIDTINKYILGDTKNYYLSYSDDVLMYRIHEKKPKKHNGTLGVTWQGKGINIQSDENGVKSEASIYCKNNYKSSSPFCIAISKEEYDKILKLVDKKTINNNVNNNKINNVNMTTKNTNEKKSMMSSMMSKFTSQFIPTEENDVKLSMDGNLVTKQGNEYVGIVGDKNELKSYPEEMCFDVPVYSINKPSKDVKVGDIIKRKNSYYKVTSVKDNGVLSLLSFSGNYTSSKEIKDAVLNQSFERVLFNYFNQTDNTSFNPMMFMFMKDSNVDMETLMMMSMMNQNGNSGLNFGNMFGSNSNMNPMMMLMLMKDKGDSSMKDMMMLSMMGNMFNQNKQ